MQKELCLYVNFCRCYAIQVFESHVWLHYTVFVWNIKQNEYSAFHLK